MQAVHYLERIVQLFNANTGCKVTSSMYPNTIKTLTNDSWMGQVKETRCYLEQQMRELDAWISTEFKFHDARDKAREIYSEVYKQVWYEMQRDTTNTAAHRPSPGPAMSVDGFSYQPNVI